MVFISFLVVGRRVVEVFVIKEKQKTSFQWGQTGEVLMIKNKGS